MICFDSDNASGKVKVRFSHVDNGWLVQTDQVDTKIKHEKGIVKLYDRTNSRRILSMHIPHISNLFCITFFCYIHLFNSFVSDQYDVNNMINDIFHDINKDMFAVVEKVLEHQLLEIFNNVFSQFSYSQLFPL